MLTAGFDWLRDRADVVDPWSPFTAARGNRAGFAQYQGKFDAHDLQASLRRDDNDQFGGKTTGGIAWGYGFAEGWRFVRDDAPTRRMILIMAANALFCSPFVMVLLTFYARRTLGLDAAAIGWLMSLTGIGALIASFGLLAIPTRKRPAVLRVGAACSVVAMLILAVAEHFAVAALAYGLLTLGLNFIFGIGSQLVQERAPASRRWLA